MPKGPYIHPLHSADSHGTDPGLSAETNPSSCRVLSDKKQTGGQYLSRNKKCFSFRDTTNHRFSPWSNIPILAKKQWLEGDGLNVRSFGFTSGFPGPFRGSEEARKRKKPQGAKRRPRGWDNKKAAEPQKVTPTSP